MKIISLNAYGGHVFEPLMEFIKKQGPSTDIFCFQEMVSAKVDNPKPAKNGWRVNLLQEVLLALPDHDVYFAPMQDDFETEPDIPGQSQIGVAIFYRKSLNVVSKGDFFLCNGFNSYVPGDYSTIGHNLAYVTFDISGRQTVVCSLHGNAQPADKRDSPLRLEQSKRILDFLEPIDASKIVMGDFNLFPDTESINLFEKAGFRNLITENKITTTRGSLMRKLFPQYEHGKYGFQEYADYTFVTPDVNVSHFFVPDEPISDHLPMILEC